MVPCVWRNNNLLKYSQGLSCLYAHTLFWRRWTTLLPKPVNSQTQKYLQVTCKVPLFLPARLWALTLGHWAISGTLRHSTLTETSKKDISAQQEEKRLCDVKTNLPVQAQSKCWSASCESCCFERGEVMGEQSTAWPCICSSSESLGVLDLLISSRKIYIVLSYPSCTI